MSLTTIVVIVTIHTQQATAVNRGSATACSKVGISYLFYAPIMPQQQKGELPLHVLRQDLLMPGQSLQMVHSVTCVSHLTIMDLKQPLLHCDPVLSLLGNSAFLRLS